MITFDLTILYKSGNKHTVHGLKTFTLKENGAEWEAVDGNDKILKLGFDAIEAVFYRPTPFYKKALRFIFG
jgi:hypothetical protein